MEKEYQVTFKGFKTSKQAEEFAMWYAGSGEQDVCLWLEEHTDITSANTKSVKIKENGNIIVEINPL